MNRQPLTKQEALHKAAALCSLAEQSRTDILQKLTKWGIPDEEQSEIIERLIGEHFLDEQRFCQSFVNDKFTFNKWGKIKIRYQLQLKKIDPATIEEALQTLDEEKYTDALSDILRVKNKTIKDTDPRSRFAKLLRFASSRGFELETIYKVLKTDGLDD